MGKKPLQKTTSASKPQSTSSGQQHAQQPQHPLMSQGHLLQMQKTVGNRATAQYMAAQLKRAQGTQPAQMSGTTLGQIAADLGVSATLGGIAAYFGLPLLVVAGIIGVSGGSVHWIISTLRKRSQQQAARNDNEAEETQELLNTGNQSNEQIDSSSEEEQLGQQVEESLEETKKQSGLQDGEKDMGEVVAKLVETKEQPVEKLEKHPEKKEHANETVEKLPGGTIAHTDEKLKKLPEIIEEPKDMAVTAPLVDEKIGPVLPPEAAEWTDFFVKHADSYYIKGSGGYKLTTKYGAAEYAKWTLHLTSYQAKVDEQLRIIDPIRTTAIPGAAKAEAIALTHLAGTLTAEKRSSTPDKNVNNLKMIEQKVSDIQYQYRGDRLKDMERRINAVDCPHVRLAQMQESARHLTGPLYEYIKSVDDADFEDHMAQCLSKLNELQAEKTRYLTAMAHQSQRRLFIHPEIGGYSWVDHDVLTKRLAALGDGRTNPHRTDNVLHFHVGGMYTQNLIYSWDGNTLYVHGAVSWHLDEKMSGSQIKEAKLIEDRWMTGKGDFVEHLWDGGDYITTDDFFTT